MVGVSPIFSRSGFTNAEAPQRDSGQVSELKLEQMGPQLIGSNDEAFEDALCRQSLAGTGDEAKAATEKFLRDAISKADAHLSLASHTSISSWDELFRDLSEISGLCAWHSRKLTRLLSLVRADGCNIGMIQALEKPLTDFFSGVSSDDFLVSVKDYTFYSGIKLEGATKIGGIDRDLVHWVELKAEKWSFTFKPPVAAMDSLRSPPPVVEALDAIDTRLREWKCRIHAMRTNEDSKLQDIKVKISNFIGTGKRPNSAGNNDRMLLGASPRKFESLIDRMQTLIRGIEKELKEFDEVTSKRHERELIVLQDDIRLQAREVYTQERTNSPGSAIVRQSDSTPYQRAQALEGRVKDWVRHEMEFCQFRKDLQRVVSGKKDLIKGIGWRKR